MVDKSTSSWECLSSWMFIIGQTGLTTSSRGEAPFECFCWHLHRLPRDRILLPHLTCVTLKRKPAARGTRAPRLPSIVDGFSRLPWLVFAADSVVPEDCHLALVAARAPPAALCADAQNDSRLATTPDGCIVLHHHHPVSPHRALASKRRGGGTDQVLRAVAGACR